MLQTPETAIINETEFHYFNLLSGTLYHNDGRVIKLGNPEEYLDIEAAMKRIENQLRSNGIIEQSESIWVDV